LEEWEIGRLEEGKIGRLENWKFEESVFQFFNILFFYSFFLVGTAKKIPTNREDDFFFLSKRRVIPWKDWKIGRLKV
jgi:hypothetical protein